jgi:hypothetical protein
MAQQSARRGPENQGFPQCFEHALGDMDRARELPYRPAAAQRRITGRTDGSIRLRATAIPKFSLATKGGVHRWKAELHRLTGTVLVARNKLDEGESSLQEAIRIAQAQQAKSLELRAARDLARLWGEQGRRAEARDLLSPVYGWFTEGFDTADLKEAKALLDALT